MRSTHSPSLLLQGIELPWGLAQETVAQPLGWRPRASVKRTKAATNAAVAALAGTRMSRNLLFIIPAVDTTDGGAILDVPRLHHTVIKPLPGFTAPLTSKDARPEPQLQSVSEALRWMKGVTGLPDRRVAALLGVQRQTLHNWLHGSQMSDANRRRVLVTSDILRRAWTWHGTAQQLCAWLDTPRGSAGFTPAMLLEAGDTDQARYLAVAVRSSEVRRAPAWAERLRESDSPGRERFSDATPPEPDFSEGSLAVEPHTDAAGWERVVEE